MALPEQTIHAALSASDLSDTDSESDDSRDDPTFEIAQEIGSSLSSLSINRKSKARARVSHRRDEEDADDDSHAIPIVLPKLDEKDERNYDDIIQKLIQAGHVEKLKVDQCRVYLRKHGLRLTGTKETLILRVKEHLEICDVGGETKYPPSSFVVNCKGDACSGDVVLFEQNVYEMFSIASRSANGPPCGTRVVAGRIVKESYGTAKQQHTFTIEVLWSKGEKPLPPLHPLLIKGRNLYRLKTMRQKWEDEGKRQNMLAEKHARGFVARSNREARVNEREMRKKMKANRVGGTKDVHGTVGNGGTMPNFLSATLKNEINQCPQQLKNKQNPSGAGNFTSMECQDTRGCLKVDDCSEMLYSKRQPLSSMSCNVSGAPSGIQVPQQYYTFKHPFSSDQPGFPGKRFANQNEVRGKNPASFYFQRHAMYEENIYLEAARISSQGWSYRSSKPPVDRGNLNAARIAKQVPSHDRSEKFEDAEHLASSTSNKKIQVCRYYAQGRCYYGDNCKYLHVKQGN